MNLLTDAELVAVYDAAYNAADDGELRVSVLELVGLRAVYEAGQADATPNHGNGSQ